MKVCLVQLRVAAVSESLQNRIDHVEKLIRTALSTKDGATQTVDLIVLPETAFCSYCQPDSARALAIANAQEDGVKEFGKRLAVEYACYVAFGYIGKGKTGPSAARNSLAVFAPNGEMVHDQTKRFLYDSDLNWTTERGDAFEAIELEQLDQKPRVMFAICNDINAIDFSDLEMNKYPLAHAALEKKANLVVLSTAWCSAHPDSPAWEHDEPITEENQVSYWIERLKPLWGSNVFFCSADLVGREAIPRRSPSRIKYCGSSCVISLRTKSLLTTPLSTSKEGVLVVDVPLVL